MTSEYDRLEEYIMGETENKHTETVVDHAMNPRNVGNIQDADGFASVTGPCGDTMEIWLRIRQDRIQEATFWTDGCGTTIAAGSMTTELARDKTAADALRISQQEVLDALGGLPEENRHCALLTVNTLKEAVKDYLKNKREPWKRVYRKH